MIKVSDIDACLPQTQCKECDYDGCLPYAEAIYNGQATIDKCPPGGIETLNRLAKIMGVDSSSMLEAAKQNTRTPQLAVIREDECIGCTKCIQACPVDAIVGAAKLMHSIITHECTGCNLCVEPCPVDCIDMVDIDEPAFDATIARENYNRKKSRLIRLEQQRKQQYLAKRKLANEANRQQETQAKQAYILEALARVKNKTEAIDE